MKSNELMMRYRNKNNSEKKSIFNFDNDYKRMGMELLAFSLIMIFFEVVAAIPLSYVMGTKYIIMFIHA